MPIFLPALQISLGADASPKCQLSDSELVVNKNGPHHHDEMRRISRGQWLLRGKNELRGDEGRFPPRLRARIYCGFGSGNL